MREIRFRAWDKKDKLMYFEVQKGIRFEDESYYEFERFLGNQKSDDYHEWELMQYTGLKDKKDVEIYEGDILDWPEKYKMEDGVVVFTEGGFWVQRKYGGTQHDENHMPSQDRREVIGHIYKNGDLIK